MEMSHVHTWLVPHQKYTSTCNVFQSILSHVGRELTWVRVDWATSWVETCFFWQSVMTHSPGSIWAECTHSTFCILVGLFLFFQMVYIHISKYNVKVNIAVKRRVNLTCTINLLVITVITLHLLLNMLKAELYSCFIALKNLGMHTIKGKYKEKKQLCYFIASVNING